MKQLAGIVLVVVLVVFTAPAMAAGRCDLLGSWIGYDATGNAWWMSTADGPNGLRGTLNLEVPASAAFFPGTAGVTELRGGWERTGPRSYDWTVASFSYDASLQTVYLARLSGRDRLGDGCDTLYVTDVVLEVFLPDADLEVDDPIQTSAFPDHVGFRINVNRP